MTAIKYKIEEIIKKTLKIKRVTIKGIDIKIHDRSVLLKIEKNNERIVGNLEDYGIISEILNIIKDNYEVISIEEEKNEDKQIPFVNVLMNIDLKENLINLMYINKVNRYIVKAKIKEYALNKAKMYVVFT